MVALKQAMKASILASRASVERNPARARVRRVFAGEVGECWFVAENNAAVLDE